MDADGLFLEGIGLFLDGQFILFKLLGVQTARYFKLFSGNDDI